jgi:hypothetical protein
MSVTTLSESHHSFIQFLPCFNLLKILLFLYGKVPNQVASVGF